MGSIHGGITHVIKMGAPSPFCGLASPLVVVGSLATPLREQSIRGEYR